MIFHTDQSGEYTGEIFAAACRSAGVTPSMGAPGRLSTTRSRNRSTRPCNGSCCTTNHFHTGEEARHAVATWIDDYNSQRRHSTNGMLSPIAYEHARTQRHTTNPDTKPDKGRAA